MMTNGEHPYFTFATGKCAVLLLLLGCSLGCDLPEVQNASPSAPPRSEVLCTEEYEILGPKAQGCAGCVAYVDVERTMLTLGTVRWVELYVFFENGFAHFVRAQADVNAKGETMVALPEDARNWGALRGASLSQNWRFANPEVCCHGSVKCLKLVTWYEVDGDWEEEEWVGEY